MPSSEGETFSLPRPVVDDVPRLVSSSLISNTPVECCIRLVISSSSVSTWISKSQDAGIEGEVVVAVGVDLDEFLLELPDNAVAMENGL